MKRFLALVTVIAALTAALTARHGASLDDMTMIRVIGIDASDGGLRLSVTAVEPASVRENETPSAVFLAADGTDLRQAAETLASYSAKSVFWGFAEYLVLGESARPLMGSILPFLLTDNAIRPNITVLALDAGSAESVLASSVGVGLFLSDELKALFSEIGRNPAARRTTAADLAAAPSDFPVPVLTAHTNADSFSTADAASPLWFRLDALAVYRSGVVSAPLARDASVGLNLLRGDSARSLALDRVTVTRLGVKARLEHGTLCLRITGHADGSSAYAEAELLRLAEAALPYAEAALVPERVRLLSLGRRTDMPVVLEAEVKK